jgi:hypothetical protein
MISFNGGDVEKQIKGKPVTFRFNMASLTMLGDLQNASLTALAYECMNPKLSTLANFLYSGAYVYCKQEKKKIDFTQDIGPEWDAELGIDGALDMLLKAFELPDQPESESEKNQIAP